MNPRAAVFLSCILVILLFSSCCVSDGHGPVSAQQTVPVASPPAGIVSNDTLVAFVDSAVAYVRDRGAARALAEFNNPNGSFTRGDLYIYAYGFNGTTLAHPVNPEAVGKTREGSTGVFVTEMGAVVRNGSGFYRFTYVNPAHNRTLESKLGYGVKIDDGWWIGSGIYTGPVGTAATPAAAPPAP
jgi:hypothetical protein